MSIGTPPIDLGPFQGTALTFKGEGILICGPSGAGKSLLALALLDRAMLKREPAALISDDLVHLDRGEGDEEGQILLRAPDQHVGKIELRFGGVVDRKHQPKAPLSLIVQFCENAPRLPEPNDRVHSFSNLDFPLCKLPISPALDIFHQILLVEEALAQRGQ